MLELIKTVHEYLRRLSSDDFAKFMAYCLAPFTVLMFVVSGPFGGLFGIETARPIAISELKTEQSLTGTLTPKPGFVLVIEPVASDFRIQLPTAPSHIWSSLDDSTARANKDRLTLDDRLIVSRAPFFGVGGPVTVVVPGQLGAEVQVPGGAEKTDDLTLRSRRSVSLMTGVLLVCVFALGMSSVTGLPLENANQHTRG
jgi:hypothetical protein